MLRDIGIFLFGVLIGSGIAAIANGQATRIPSPPITSPAEYNLVVFESNFCLYCKLLKQTLKNEEVIAALNKNRIKVITVNTSEPDNAKLLTAWGVSKLPTLVLVSPAMRDKPTIELSRRVGYMSEKAVIEMLQTPPK